MYERIPGVVRFYQNYFPFLKSGHTIPFVEVTLPDQNVKKLSVGCGFVGFVDDDNKVFMWGDNYAGQLGMKDAVHRDFPIIIDSLINDQIVDID